MKCYAWILLVFVPTSALAQLDTSGLSDEQEAELQLQIAKMKNDKLPASAEEAEKWAAWGTGIGKAISSTASELGVAVDEFSCTPVCQITIGVIVYKVIGKDILRALAGFTLFFATIFVWVKWLRKPFVKIQYDGDGKVKSREYRAPDSDAELAIYWVHNWLTLIAGILASFLVAFAG